MRGPGSCLLDQRSCRRSTAPWRRRVMTRSFLLKDWGALRLELTGDGATLIVHSDDDKALALSVPPWGDRLRNRLVKN
jgi:hypothetical protein